MPDIFLSYSRDDLSTARRFAEAFEREGFSVWWDQTLNPGEAFDEVTEKALNEARAVVVLWSKKSVASRWVRAEATQANDSKTLVPVMIEPCKRPIMFELTHTADLSSWKGNSSDPNWQSYLAGVKRIVGKEAALVSSPAAQSHTLQKARFSAGALIGIVGLLVAVGFGLWAISRMPAEIPKRADAVTTKSQSPAVVPAPARAAGKPRIAILPFENLSPDPKNAFFTDGMHDEILSALTNGAPDLEVISRTTMMTYRAAHMPIAEIARELNATYVLTGTLRRDDQDVRLTLELIDARSDGQMWSQNFNRKLVKAMTLQSEVAGEVAKQLSVKLAGAARIAVPPTTDPQAFDLYLKARLEQQILLATLSSDLATWRKVETLLTQAISRDPSFALAYAERSVLRLRLFVISLDASETMLDAARTDLDSAERLRPNDPAWNVLEASWKSLDHEYARALALLSSAEAAGLVGAETLQIRADVMGHMGLYEDALPLLDRAVALDPANSFILSYRAMVLNYTHRTAEALEAFRLTGERVSAYAPLGTLLRAYIRYGYTGDRKTLLTTANRYRPGDPGPLQIGDDYRQYRKLAEAEAERQPAGAIGLFAPTGVGDIPARALGLGDLDLLLGDRAAAARDGQAVLAFVAGERVTRYNEWFLKVLTARGKLFLDDKPGALGAAREALSLVPRSLDAVHWAIASSMTVDVLARCGAQDEAVTTLEQLAVAVPGAMPTQITREPGIAVPLANNARYKALRAKLEAQMAATKLD